MNKVHAVDKQTDLFPPGAYAIGHPDDMPPIPTGWYPAPGWQEVMDRQVTRHERQFDFTIKTVIIKYDVAVRFPTDWRPVKEVKKERVPRTVSDENLVITLDNGTKLVCPFKPRASLGAFIVREVPSGE